LHPGAGLAGVGTGPKAADPGRRVPRENQFLRGDWQGSATEC